MKIVRGRFLEGETLTIKVNGQLVERKVRYNKSDGLYFIYKNKKYFDYEFTGRIFNE